MPGNAYLIKDLGLNSVKYIFKYRMELLYFNFKHWLLDPKFIYSFYSTNKMIWLWKPDGDI